MATRQPEQRPLLLPQWGQIMAGPLKGWRYSFLQCIRVERNDESKTAVCCFDLRCTPPNWPFPKDVRFDPFVDDLSVVPGPRAKQLDLRALMDLAMERGYARAAFEYRK